MDGQLDAGRDAARHAEGLSIALVASGGPSSRADNEDSLDLQLPVRTGTVEMLSPHGKHPAAAAELSSLHRRRCCRSTTALKLRARAEHNVRGPLLLLSFTITRLGWDDAGGSGNSSDAVKRGPRGGRWQDARSAGPA